MFTEIYFQEELSILSDILLLFFRGIMLNSAENLWGMVLNDLQSNINKQTFDAWFKDTSVIKYSDNILTIKVQDDVAQRYITNSYSKTINELLKKNTGTDYLCNFIYDLNKNVIENKQDIVKPETEVRKMEKENSSSIELNSYYTFETFVIGANNQFAHAAALNVSKNPAGVYNPLFLYGNSGVGKTHLLQAIGHQILKDKPYLKVLYIKTEQFLNEFINAMKNQSMHQFKLKFRYVDILLIDDIQFLSDKIQLQEEFFHTFDELHNKRKQIVLTSDRPPKEISHLTERLKTRFLGGLLADIQIPNLETREAILRRKAEILGIDISEEVINYIASRIKSNIRSLEASLININHVANILQNKRITIEMAKTHLKPLFEENQNKQITISDILEKVAVKYETTPDLIISKNRHNSIIMPRFIAIYLSTQLTNLTTIEIGKEFGKRDHSTVINARKNIESLLKEDDNIKEIIEEIRSELKS